MRGLPLGAQVGTQEREGQEAEAILQPQATTGHPNKEGVRKVTKKIHRSPILS